TGNGQCYKIAKDVFARGHDGRSVVLIANVDEVDVDRQLQAQSAEMMCPEGAISFAATNP
ncbi:MAG: ferredoxin, partial [Pseudomonadales bacterium]